MNSTERQARIKELFLAAARLPGEERDAWLEENCEGDENLVHEVRSLLEHHGPATILAEAARTGKAVIPPRQIGPGQALHSTWKETGNRLGSKALGTPLRRGLTIALALALLFGVAWVVRGSTKRSLEEILKGNLETVLNADVLALEIWIEERLDEAQLWANYPEIRSRVEILATAARKNPGGIEGLRNSREIPEFYNLLEPYLAREDSLHVSLIDREGIAIAEPETASIGKRLGPLGWQYMARVFEGEAVFVRPYRESEGDSAERASSRLVLPTRSFTAACAPVQDSSGRIVASLNLLQDASGPFTRILSVARMGASGETYAFDENGLLLSESRFTDDLVKFGLLGDDAEQQGAALRLEVRDPGGNLYAGHIPTLEPAARPLTRATALAIASRAGGADAPRQGVLLKPYNDYRGVKVIGAWKWLPAHGFGVATEVDSAEAYAPLRTLDLAVGSLFGLLTIATGGYILSSLSVVRLRHEIGVARQLGSYTLISKIGQGGMGEVYLARHAMLKRPTAIKILRRNLASDDPERRFEREVQAASRLTSPNTIEIYDYGRTADGVFYYAMEFLDGLTLGSLSRETGRIPASRVIHILRQVCVSLHEAHEIEIIHRDIKPGNIMLCERGGNYDVVKVLDFGLVKHLGPDEENTRTRLSEITGTPLYMAPERIRASESVDARSDLYSVGAVGYFLLSGAHLFSAPGDVEVLHQVANVPPQPLSEFTALEVPPGLEELIMNCLAKDPGERPASAADMIESLEALEAAYPWSRQEAKAWWRSRASQAATPPSP